MNKEYEKRKIMNSLLFSLPFVVVIIVLYVNGLEFGKKLVLVGLSFVFLLITNFRWMDLYDRKFKNDYIWDFGLNSGMKRIPHPIKNEPELNVRFFVFFKWIIITITIVFL